MKNILLYTGLLLWAGTLHAFELVSVKAGDNIHALVGEIGPRTTSNHALNNTLGFVVTDGGVVLIGTGATPAGAQVIEQAIAAVTSQPVRWVINIGAQDHHWMGNDHFASTGAEIIALSRTVAAQKQHVDDHLSRLRQAVPQEAATIKPFYAPTPIDADKIRLNLGGEQFVLMWPGGGHFDGDAILWMPRRKAVFTGDYVFNDRMLGVQPYSQVLQWQRSFHKIAALQPQVLIPGHGYPGDLAKAQRDTGDYLDWLISEVGKAQQDWKDIGDTVNDLAAAPAFSHLKFYDSWHRKNINQTYLYLEASQ